MTLELEKASILEAYVLHKVVNEGKMFSGGFKRLYKSMGYIEKIA